MARRAFFSFEYSDVTRAMVVRNSWVAQGRESAGFIDSAEFEKLERKGDAAVKAWIDRQLLNTSVTAVLVGASTCSSKWVQYEIDQSKARGNGLLGIDISQIKNLAGWPTYCCGRIPSGYSFYSWSGENGYYNIGTWIEAAAKAAGR
jgi:hypothetical protein